MTAIVQSRLVDLEEVIAAGLATWFEVGMALAEIRDCQLYKQSYSRFEDYCRERWGWGRSYAAYLIGSAKVTDRLSVDHSQQTLPQTETQARPLTKLQPEDQPRAWQRAVEIAATEKRSVIAADVEEAVSEIKGEREPTPRERRSGPQVHVRDPRIKLIEEAIRNLRAARKGSEGLIARELGAIMKNLQRLLQEMV